MPLITLRLSAPQLLGAACFFAGAGTGAVATVAIPTIEAAFKHPRSPHDFYSASIDVCSVSLVGGLIVGGLGYVARRRFSRRDKRPDQKPAP